MEDVLLGFIFVAGLAWHRNESRCGRKSNWDHLWSLWVRIGSPPMPYTKGIL